MLRHVPSGMHCCCVANGAGLKLVAVTVMGVRVGGVGCCWWGPSVGAASSSLPARPPAHSHSRRAPAVGRRAPTEWWAEWWGTSPLTLTVFARCWFARSVSSHPSVQMLPLLHVIRRWQLEDREPFVANLTPLWARVERWRKPLVDHRLRPPDPLPGPRCRVSPASV